MFLILISSDICIYAFNMKINVIKSTLYLNCVSSQRQLIKRSIKQSLYSCEDLEKNVPESSHLLLTSDLNGKL